MNGNDEEKRIVDIPEAIPRITAKTYEEQWAEYVRMREENPGKRGFGEATTKMKIGALLGFEELSDRWKVKASMGCPVNRSYVRQSMLNTFVAPAGLFSVELNLHYGKTWHMGRNDYNFTTEARLVWPDPPPGSVGGTIIGLPVFDTERAAIDAACDVGMKWLNEEEKGLRDLLDMGGEEEDLPPNCPLSLGEMCSLLDNIHDLKKWISGFVDAEEAEEDVSPAKTVADATGQGYIFPEAGMPKGYTDQALERAQAAMAFAKAQEEGAKEEKKLAASIYETKKRQLGWTEVQAKIEEARVESIKFPGRVFVAVDCTGDLMVTRGKDIKDIRPAESAFYAAFLKGIETKISDAAVLDAEND